MEGQRGVGVERCGGYRGGGSGGGSSLRREEGAGIASGNSGGVPMVDMGDVGSVGGNGVLGHCPCGIEIFLFFFPGVCLSVRVRP